MNIKNLITKLILNKDLSDSELNLIFNKIINAEINENLISAILTLITRNGFNYKTILSAAKILRKKLIKVKVPKNSMDIVVQEAMERIHLIFQQLLQLYWLA